MAKKLKQRKNTGQQTWLQQNLQISTNTEYGCFLQTFLKSFCKPDVLDVFVNLTFCNVLKRFVSVPFPGMRGGGGIGDK
jgi:hypothetical protein